MTRPVLILRPQPGALATATRAGAMGLEPIVAPIFAIEGRAFTPPDARSDALLITSANAAIHAGAPDRPIYAVGEATAAVLRDLGFSHIIVGHTGVQDLVDRAAADGRKSLLHLTGEDSTPFDPRGLRIETRVAYAAVPVDPGSGFQAALDRGAVTLLHSRRAALRFRELTGPGHQAVAISANVADAAGAPCAVADRPTDAALLAAAARLCQG